MSSGPDVSVVMSVFNGATTVATAIESVLAQTGLDFEFVVVDDGSTDSTAALLSRYAADIRLRTIQNGTNIGLAASLNRGIRSAASGIIARMDADDECLPGRLATQLAFLKANPDISVVGTGVLVGDATSLRLRRVLPPRSPDMLYRRRFRECPVIHPTVMFRRDAVLAAGGYDPLLRRGQDYDLWLRMMRQGRRFSNVDAIGLRYAPPEAPSNSAVVRAALRVSRHAIVDRHWRGAAWAVGVAGAHWLNRHGLLKFGLLR